MLADLFTFGPLVLMMDMIQGGNRMVKVAPKNQKSIQQQKIKESRSTLKRTFNACVKEKINEKTQKLLRKNISI